MRDRLPDSRNDRGMAMGKKFKIRNSSFAKEIELPDSGELRIGRRSGCDIQIDGDAKVSRSHALVSIGPWGVSVEDDGSSLGTQVNSERISERCDLKNGDRIVLGDTTITYESDAPASQPAVEVDGRFKERFRLAELLSTPEMLELKRQIHAMILLRLNAGGKAANLASDKELAARAEQCLDQVLLEIKHRLPDESELPAADLRQALVDDLLRYGPITPMLAAPDITEIMVNGPDRIFVESAGRLYETGARFVNEAHLLQIIERIVEPLGRQVNPASPMVDARLPDGSRVNAIVPPLALDGPSLTIRKFAERRLTTDDLIAFGSMTREMAVFLEEAVRSRQSILVSGGTGSGKTTLLNILSQFIPEGERLVTVEDSAELKLSHRNIVRLEARPSNSDGKGRVTIRDLVINCLRMRPDRIIVGECRGAEALDMLQAMNTGHDGSLTTCHANNPRDAMSRLENMVMMAGYELPSSAIREQIANAIDLVVQQSRMPDGTRKIVKIVEVTGREGDVIQTQDIFEFRQTGIGPEGQIEGNYSATGNIPYFIDEQRQRGVLRLDMDIFVPKS